MLKDRFWPLAAGTVTCALAIGFLMQNVLVEHVTTPKNSAPGLLDDRPAVVTRATTSAFSDLIEIARSPGSALGQTPVPDSPPQLVTAPIATPRQVQTVATDPCLVSVETRPIGKARVQIEVDAPCTAHALVTVHHTGLSFTEVADASGHLDLTIPALSENAVFIVTVNGQSIVSTTTVSDLDAWHRVAMQWADESDFQIHAREFGAGYNGPGHVWLGTPENPASGSFITRLGSPDLPSSRQIEVYSIPVDQINLQGIVALSVETEITYGSCGTNVSAQVLERHSGAALQSRDVALQMPGCSAIGDFLVLNNLLDDLKIAAK